MIDDELELMGRVLRAQAPVVLASDWVVVDDDSCLAWVEVRLHRPGALVVLHLSHRRGRSHDPHSLMAVSRWHEDDEVDVEVEFAVDGEPVGHGAATRPDVDQRRAELRIGLLKAGGRSSGGKTEEEWWLPRHPERTLEVRLRWVDGTREAAVTLDTTAWSAQAALVRELGGPEH